MHKAIPIYTDDNISAIMNALVNSSVIIRPPIERADLMAAGYRVGSRQVEFLIPAYVYRGLRAALEHNWDAVDMEDVVPRMMYLEEPGWAPSWCIVSPENTDALLLQVRARRVFDLLMDSVMST